MAAPGPGEWYHGIHAHILVGSDRKENLKSNRNARHLQGNRTQPASVLGCVEVCVPLADL